MHIKFHQKQWKDQNIQWVQLIINNQNMDLLLQDQEHMTAKQDKMFNWAGQWAPSLKQEE